VAQGSILLLLSVNKINNKMENITFTFSGFINEVSVGDTYTIQLINGTKSADLIKKFRAIHDLYESEVNVSFFCSDTQMTESEIQASWVKEMAGALVAGIEYRAWSTGGFSSISSLEVGGHDLYNELCFKSGKWAVIKVSLTYSHG